MLKVLKIVFLLVYFELAHYVHDALDKTDSSYAFEVTFGLGVLIAIVTPSLLFKSKKKES